MNIPATYTSLAFWREFTECCILILQDFASDIKSQACQMQVHKYVELAAQDIRFDVPLADACYEDRQKLCASVPPVGLIACR